MDVRLRRDLLCSIFLRAANRFIARELFLFVLAFSCHPYLRAQTQTAQKGEFHQSSWGPEDGIGAVFDVQQSQDGYLWLTTSRGVLRFDSVKFENMQEVSNGAIRNDEAYTVMAGRGDYVWLTTRAAGLLLWKGGKVTAFPFDRRCVTSSLTNGMVEDLDGSLWVRALSGLYHLNGSACDMIGREQGYPGGLPGAIFVDTNDTVWVKAPSGALVSRSRGESKFRLRQYVSGPSSNPAFLGEDPNGGIWISDDNGIRPVNVRAPAIHSPLTTPTAPVIAFPFGDFAFAPDHSLWVVTPDRLSHLSREQWQRHVAVDTTSGDQFMRGNGLSSDVLWRIFVSREGDIWIASNSGLDQLRRTVLKSMELPPAKHFQYAIAAGEEGSVWIGSMGLPLMHVKADGTVKSFPTIHDVTCIRRDRHGTVWVAANRLFRVREGRDPAPFEMHYPQEDSARVVAIAVDRNDELWVTLRPGATYHMVKGKWRDESDALGKKPGVVGDMMTDDAGNIWFAFATYLVRWDGKSYQKYFYPTGPLDISVVTMAIGDDHVWLAGRGGTIMFAGGHFYPMTYDDRDLPGRVSGIVETETGDLWMNGTSGINHVSADDVKRYMRNPQSSLHAKHFDVQDGLPGFSAERFPVPSMVESGDHRLWFATTDGIASLDPISKEQRHNLLPPPTYIKSILANGVRFAAANGLRLPKRTENVEIDYTALSLTIPRRVLFRYKLDRVDEDWQEASGRREAFYTKLPPGTYTFHVVASNNDGVWNSSGASLEFTIEPAFYQTWWLKTASVIAALAVIAWVIRLRMQVIAQNIHARLAERLDERERIARELHDTLLQGVLSASIQLDLAEDQLAKDSPVRGLVHRVLESLRQVTEEGRMALRGLRFQDIENDDLAKAFLRVKQEFPHKDTVMFRVVAQGAPRAVRTEVRNEIYRIGREAIVNAYVHSEAATIEAEIQYARTQLCLLVRDDGRGIDSSILQDGRDGHWGLSGMRERSRRIGATLKLRSRPGAGTEIELMVPGHIAFEDDSYNSTPRWLSWLGRDGFNGSGRKARDKQNVRRE